MPTSLIILSSLLGFPLGLAQHVITDDFLEKFYQQDYEIKFERSEMQSYNKDYVQKVNVVVFKHNRTNPAINASIAWKNDVGMNMDVVIQAYKFSGNDYRLFPLRFQVNLCDVISKNVFGLNRKALSKCELFTGCPFAKGKLYNMCNVTPDVSRFPPYMPSGRFMNEVQFLYGSTEYFMVRIYLEISRPFSGK